MCIRDRSLLGRTEGPQALAPSHSHIGTKMFERLPRMSIFRYETQLLGGLLTFLGVADQIFGLLALVSLPAALILIMQVITRSASRRVLPQGVSGRGTGTHITTRRVGRGWRGMGRQSKQRVFFSASKRTLLRPSDQPSCGGTPIVASLVGTTYIRECCLFSTRCGGCLLYTSPSPRDLSTSRMPSSA